MYYSDGNYEALVHPKKPDGVDEKMAYIVGAGLGGLATAAFLIHDGNMKGERIHILDEDPIGGGACDGLKYADKGFVIRGGREMENHFECLWDLFSFIPSLEHPEMTVLDEYYYLNKEDPNFSLMRATVNRGEDAGCDGKFTLSDKAALSLSQLFITPERDLQDKTIEEVLDPEFFESNFWLYWRTMFAFETWHSALEMKRYLSRFVHHIGGLPDFSALKFTKYNQYESLILPLLKYLEDHGVKFEYNTRVLNVRFSIEEDKKVATAIDTVSNGKNKLIPLKPNQLVFITNGSLTENSAMGDQHTPAEFRSEPLKGGCWEMWEKIASQSEEFGNPKPFCGNTQLSNWESATVTTLDNKIPPYIEKICKRDPFSGRVVTGGIVTVKDSSWLLSWTVNRQPHFKTQPKDELVVWVYSLFTDRPGDFVKKPMKDCSGVEICEEWLYHLGVPEEEIPTLAEKSANTVPVMMPYVTSLFMPRKITDRPKVVPSKAVNFAFIGQFTETPRDTIFTTEYSVRTAMESVYTLLNIDRGVPEVFPSCYDVRFLMKAMTRALDGRKITDLKLPFIEREALKIGIKKLKGTDIYDMLVEYGVIEDKE